MQFMDFYKELMPKIDTFIFDVDGVLTDGSVILDSSGEMVRTMNTKDGFALQHAIKKGYNVCIIVLYIGIILNYFIIYN